MYKRLFKGKMYFKKFHLTLFSFFKSQYIFCRNEVHFLFKMRENVLPVVIISLAKEHFKVTNHWCKHFPKKQTGNVVWISPRFIKTGVRNKTQYWFPNDLVFALIKKLLSWGHLNLSNFFCCFLFTSFVFCLHVMSFPWNSCICKKNMKKY